MNAWTLGDNNKGDVKKAVVTDTTVTFNYPCQYSYDCTYFTTKLPPGLYKFEVWGASGGRAYQNGAQTDFSRGGYSVGVYQLNEPSDVFVWVGGKGEDSQNPSTTAARGGFNGGGYADKEALICTEVTCHDDAGGAGGGASDIRIGINDFDHRVIVAGGAGGAGWCTKASNYNIDEVGYGGGLVAGPPKPSSNVYSSASQSSGYQKGLGQPFVEQYNRNSAGGGGGGYWGGLTANSDGHGGGGSGYVGGVTSFRDITAETKGGNQIIPTLSGSTMKGNSGNGIARITLLGYILTLKNPVRQFYEPASRISLDFTLSSLGNAETANITRSINGSTPEIAKIHKDEGQPYDFTDSFISPEQIGYFRIVYTIKSLSQTTTELTVDVLVCYQPTIETIVAMKTQFVGNEIAETTLDIFDFNSVTLFGIENENDIIYNSKIICNNKINRTAINFVISPTKQPGINYTISFYAVNEFNIKSEYVNFWYIIVTNSAPKIALNENITYYLIHYQPLKINASLLDYEENSIVCLNILFDGKDKHDFNCYNLQPNLQRSVFVDIKFPFLSLGVHNMSVFATDNHKAVSNFIVQHFAIIPAKFGFRCTCCCKPCRNSYLFSIVTILNGK